VQKTFATIDDIKALEKEMPVTDRWGTKTVYQQLCKTRDQFPSNSAVSYQLKSGPKDKAFTLNWTELTTQVTKAANLFRSLGVGEGEVVAYLLPTTHETLITLMGAMTAGIAAPINPTLEPEHISALLRETDAKVLVTLKAFPKIEIAQLAAEAVAAAPNVKTVVEIDLLPHLTPPTSWLVPLLRPKVEATHSAQVLDFNAALAGQNGDKLDFVESEDDRFCANFHTGGTTGMPKIAQHRHSGALYNGWIGAELLYKPTDVILCPLPLFHVFAAYPIWAGCLLSGAHVVLPTPAGYRGDGVFDNFWKLIERWGVTFMVTVPTAAAALMQREVDADISTLDGAFCGSAPLPVELFKRFQEVTGVEIIEGYGMTEATCLVSCNPKDGLRKIGSVGVSLPYTDVKIFDCDASGKVKKEMGVDEIGEICVSNHGVVAGHTYTDESKNKGLFARKKYLRTGDLGRIDEDGYLWITGRAKDLIIRGGHNIDPKMIEEAMHAHPQIALVAAVGRPDARVGELPVLYYTSTTGADISEGELRAFAEAHVPERAAWPKAYHRLDTLPLTSVGKIHKITLQLRQIEDVVRREAQRLGADLADVRAEQDSQRGVVAKVTARSKQDALRVALQAFVFPVEFVESGADPASHSETEEFQT